MGVRPKLAVVLAALAASLVLGIAPPERELAFFLLIGIAAGHLSPRAKPYPLPSRLAAGAGLGVLACYGRFAPWVGATLPLGLENAWVTVAVAVVLKTLLLSAAVEGLYLRLREDGVVGA
ncbi:MAG: hypothetical protein WD645_00480 [Dehalococcoidia bacterium]